MVITLTAPRTTIAPAAGRDTGIDLARAICVVIVVLLHAVMVGVTVTDAGPVFANAAEGTAWFAPLTWVAQIMPLFFVIGGYAGALAYRRMRRTGGTAGAFVAARVHRLLVPALLTFAVVAVALAALLAAGVGGELVRIAGFRYAQPLWFLAVFLLCQALLPALLAAHERAPLRTIVLLVAAAGAVDAMRAVTGIDAIGMLNLAFVWLALQQLGFVMADGTIDALRRRTRIVIGVAAVAVLAASMVGGVFSADLYENLNPPTVALLLVGIAQTALLSLLRAPLAAVSRRRAVAAFTGFVTARTMTIYLWHMPVLLAMAGASALVALTTGFELPEPSSAAWWLTRLPWFVVALSLTAAVAWALAGLERRRMPRATASVARISHAVLLGLAAIVLLLAAGTSVLTAIAAIALGLCALARIRGAGPRPAQAVR
ncbi:acyltransferase family protein [Microbacterium sp. Clip185]|uniref:acyltransferase family protein n=1 Tax=Microbacterium sp. Clip185 TaxID=3025663 RepID=UPI0023650B32|nr:acyltransferase [Microbacterium sp. Clip185]WDG18204.1 acyltransferase [Microbacterium sp. Clip185]